MKMKEDRIFGFKNYNDFKSNYFYKDLVVLDSMNRANQVKYARAKYSWLDKAFSFLLVNYSLIIRLNIVHSENILLSY